MKIKLLGWVLTFTCAKRKRSKKVGFSSKSWSSEDTIRAIAMYKDNHSTQEIAISLNRTVAAIGSRLTLWKKKGLI